MEGGQKLQIPLDSPLTTQSGDMLESVAEPKLTFNRQKWQGGYLPTSLRFEMNGWASGTYGYDYFVETPDPVVDVKGMLAMTVSKKHSYLSPVYTVTDEEHGVSFKLTPVTQVTKWTEHVPQIERLSPTLLKLTGTTTDTDEPYVFYMTQSLTDGSLTFFEDGDHEWEGVDYDAGETCSFDTKRRLHTVRVYDKDKNFSDTVYLYYGSALTIGEDTYEYAFRGGSHTWGDYLTISVTQDPDTGKWSDITSQTHHDLAEYDADGNGVSSRLTASGVNDLALEYWLHLEVTDTISWTTEEQLTNIAFQSITVQHSYFNDSSTSSNNRWFYHNVTEEAQKAYEDAGGTMNHTTWFQVVRLEFPVWAQFGINVSTSWSLLGYPHVTATYGLFGTRFPGLRLRLNALSWQDTTDTDYSDSTKWLKRTFTVPVALYWSDDKDDYAYLVDPTKNYSLDADGNTVTIWSGNSFIADMHVFNPKYGTDGVTENPPVDAGALVDATVFGVESNPNGSGQGSLPVYNTDNGTVTSLGVAFWSTVKESLRTQLQGLLRDPTKTQTLAWTPGVLATATRGAWTGGSGTKSVVAACHESVALPVDRGDWCTGVGDEPDYFGQVHVEVEAPDLPRTDTDGVPMTPDTYQEPGTEYYVADHPEYRYGGSESAAKSQALIDTRASYTKASDLPSDVWNTIVAYDPANTEETWTMTTTYNTTGALAETMRTRTTDPWTEGTSHTLTCRYYWQPHPQNSDLYSPLVSSGGSTDDTSYYSLVDVTSTSASAVCRLRSSLWYAYFGTQTTTATGATFDQLATRLQYFVHFQTTPGTATSEFSLVATYSSSSSSITPISGRLRGYGLWSASATVANPNSSFSTPRLTWRGSLQFWSFTDTRAVTFGFATSVAELKGSISATHSNAVGTSISRASYVVAGLTGDWTLSSTFSVAPTSATDRVVCWGTAAALATTGGVAWFEPSPLPQRAWLLDAEFTAPFTFATLASSRQLALTLSLRLATSAVSATLHPVPYEQLGLAVSTYPASRLAPASVYTITAQDSDGTLPTETQITETLKIALKDRYIQNSRTPPASSADLPTDDLSVLPDPTYYATSNLDFTATTSTDYVTNHTLLRNILAHNETQTLKWLYHRADSRSNASYAVTGPAYMLLKTVPEQLEGTGITSTAVLDASGNITSYRFTYDPSHGTYADTVTTVYWVNEAAPGTVWKTELTSVVSYTKPVYWTDKTPWIYNVPVTMYFPVVRSFEFVLEDTNVSPAVELLSVSGTQTSTGSGLVWANVQSSAGTANSFLQAMFPEGSTVAWDDVTHGTVVIGAEALGALSYCAYAGVPIYVNDIATVGFDYNYRAETGVDPLSALDLKSSGMFSIYNDDTTDEYAGGLMRAYKQGPGRTMLWTDYEALQGTVDLTVTPGSYYLPTVNDWSDIIQMFTITSNTGAYFYQLTSDEVVPYFISQGTNQYTVSTNDATRIDLGADVGTEILTHWSATAVDWVTAGVVSSTHDYYHGLAQITNSDATDVDISGIGAFDRLTYNSGHYSLDTYHQYVGTRTYYLRMGNPDATYTLSEEYVSALTYYVQDTSEEGYEYRCVEHLTEDTWEEDTYYLSDGSGSDAYLRQSVDPQSYQDDYYWVRNIYEVPVYHVDSDFDYVTLISIDAKTTQKTGTGPAGVAGGWDTLLVQKSDVYERSSELSENVFKYEYGDMSGANSPYVTIKREGYYHAVPRFEYSVTVDGDDTPDTTLRNSAVTLVSGERTTIGYNWEPSSGEWKDVLTWNATTEALRGTGVYEVSGSTEDPGNSANVEITVTGTDFDLFTFAVGTVYDVSGATLVSYDDETITLEVDGEETTVRVQDILDSKTYFDITGMSIEQSVLNTTAQVLQGVDEEAEYTVVKQAWDPDISTKAFYWLNEDTYMAVTDTTVDMYEKLDALDDWAGDKWQLKESVGRASLLPSEVLKWGVTSVTGSGNAVFWTAEVLDDTHFRLNFRDVASEGLTAPATVQTFTVAQREFNTVLAPDKDSKTLNSYQHFTAYQLVHEGELTSACVGTKLMVALHVDSALAQWTMIFDRVSFQFDHVVHGMGYVGPDGTLTGGQWPDEFFDSDIGFSGMVQDIDKLKNFKTKDIETFSEYGCYGNAIQQWYVMQELTQVVSHMPFNTTTNEHSAVYLPISTKYTAKYESTSFYMNKITGFVPQGTTLAAMLPFDLNGVSSVLATLLNIASPVVWYMVPTWTKMGFLQQSLGQYAYVYQTTAEMETGYNPEQNKNRDSSSQNPDVIQHSNSAREGLKAFDRTDEVLTRDSLSFDKQEVEQTIDESTSTQNALGGFWYAVMTQGILAITNALQQTAQVNKTVNQTVGDKARVFTQFATENALTAAATDIGMSASANISLASKVTAVKTLDMFYSTSAHSESYMGPGYACHRFIGQCVAQSVSNRFIQGNQYGMFTSLVPLSLIPLRALNAVLQVVSDTTNANAQMVSEAGIAGAWAFSAGAFANVAGIISAGVAAALRTVADTVIALNEFYIEYFPKLVECLAPNGPQFYNSGNVSSHTIDIEAKHKYGNKSVTFMWPCFEAVSTTFTEETVFATTKDTTSYVNFKDMPMTAAARQYEQKGEIDMSAGVKLSNVTDNLNKSFVKNLKGNITSRYIYCYGSSFVNHNTPQDMAVVEGVTTFLPSSAFKNENIDATCVFPVAPVQDYMWSDDWELGVTAGSGGIMWVSARDTKIMDGAPTNVLIDDDHCLVAGAYCALEIKRGVQKEYVRPVAYTPTTLAWNITGYNLCYLNDVYHAFDGVGYRMVEWHGSAGMDMEQLAFVYSFTENDHLKRSNILPPDQYFGNFRSLPSISTESYEPVYLKAEIDAWGVGIENDSPYEDRTQTRYAVPVHVEPIATLPAVVRALSSYKLDVYEGITSLTTDIRTTQSAYKAPISVDFAINKQVYRATDEYVTLINEQGLAAGDVVTKLGLQFVGATPEQAFFYSPATRAYYSFTGANTMDKVDVWNRFKDIKQGRWDFVNMEVVFECLGNMTRLYDGTSDKDADMVDNLMVPHLGNNGVDGDVTPPNKTIFDGTLEGSWFKTYSFAGGLTYQGPNRFIANRFICLDYMLEDVVANRGKWKRVSRDEFHPFRTYKQDYTDVETRITEGVKGWTHNPFLFCTAPLGVDEDTDCLYEWELTFTWTDEMDMLYGEKDYACVNIMAQTMCEGGKKRSDVTHLYLRKELFTRGSNTGYHSIRFQSRNGAGNREQLFVWSDAYVAMSGLQLEYKIVTQKRQSQLSVSDVQIREMNEF